MRLKARIGGILVTGAVFSVFSPAILANDRWMNWDFDCGAFEAAPDFEGVQSERTRIHYWSAPHVVAAGKTETRIEGHSYEFTFKLFGRTACKSRGRDGYEDCHRDHRDVIQIFVKTNKMNMKRNDVITVFMKEHKNPNGDYIVVSDLNFKYQHCRLPECDPDKFRRTFMGTQTVIIGEDNDTIVLEHINLRTGEKYWYDDSIFSGLSSFEQTYAEVCSTDYWKG